MKKIFTLLMIAMTTLGMAAKEYTGKLSVSINGNGGTQDATISLDQAEDGTFTLSIINFVLEYPDADPIGVGNIVVDGLKGVKVGDKTYITDTRTIHIPAGDRADINFWLGPMLDTYGGVPIALVTQFNDNDVNVDIDIDMTKTGLQQMINVNFTNIEAAKTYEPGDVDRNGTTNGSDVTALYNILLK